MRSRLPITVTFTLAVTVTVGCAGGGAARRPGDGPGATDGRPPGALLDLASWKLQLPYGEPGAPTEIRPPALRTYSFYPYFHVDAAGSAVIFRAHAGGVTTPRSKYPRAELREMLPDGSHNAAWSTTSGAHVMTIVQSINQLPAVRPHVVAGQIHDGNSDLVMIRLEGRHLYVQGDGRHLGTLDAAYVLGKRFTVRVAAADGRVRVYYEDMATPKVDVARAATDCYFKAGVYVQSNPARGERPDAYGEVAIAALSVTHQ